MHPVWGASYAIHECFYTKPTDSIPYTWTKTPEPVFAETPKELRKTLKSMLRATKEPVLAEYTDKLVELAR